MTETGESQWPAVPDRRYFKMKEAARLALRSPHILRYWEKEIPFLANVERRNGQRYYSREQVLVMQQVGQLLAAGATLQGAARRLSGAKTRPAKASDPNRWVRRELEKLLSIL